jgi:hypothetical protein
MNGRDYCHALAERLEVLVAEADDLDGAMDEIADAAERGGLIDNSNLPRRESPAAFVMDLLLENPTAGDWMNSRLKRMKPPGAYDRASDVAEHLS